MEPKRWRILGVLSIIAAVICFGIFVMILQSPRNFIPENYQSVGNNVYRCEGRPADVADRIAEATNPKAQAEDPKTGEHFLRYRDRIVRVTNHGPTRCEIRIESDSAYRSGGFIYLGPGFNPSSPRGSSGGSSGSSGGVK
ncbi:DUF4247 domain-containing protein [uncultured Corynebacterium sp.]|uniref:DUF4247 domain-containing protein n=1 Tax=uncultured Corynebacterium sp. TaxID=159447 RepID=UPI0025EB0018|nr:DUF4247 domain-containing protein [uncultured Corynebacterium sp.]